MAINLSLEKKHLDQTDIHADPLDVGIKSNTTKVSGRDLNHS
jgi:hypothetical protein